MSSSSRTEIITIESQALRGNRLNDPHMRELTVYLPPGYNDSDKSYPVIYFLPAHARNHYYYVNWNQYDETLPQRLDRLITNGVMPSVIVALPDFWTRFGGAQFMDSPIGNYETYFLNEILPAVDTHFRTLPSREHRGLIGHSSGGYGALRLGMLHPDLFGAISAKAPDAYWEFTALGSLSRLHGQISKYGGFAEFIEQIPTIHPKRGGFWEAIHTVMYSMAYAPNPSQPLGFDLPINMETGALIENVWEKWLQFDPLRMIESSDCQAALQTLSYIFLEVGSFDEYNLAVGARLLHRRWQELNILHEYEEFPDGHSSTSYRFDVSIPKLAKAITLE